jgi:ABC-2 type transport system permease protein
VADVGWPTRWLHDLRQWWDLEQRRPTGGSVAARAAQLWRRRDVLKVLLLRDLKRKYAVSYLGYAWTLLEPALLIAIYWLVWGHVGRLNIEHYPLFIATAMMPWLWFRQAVGSATSAIYGNKRLVTSISLPREIYPVSGMLTRTVEFFISLPLVWALAAAYRTPPSRYAFVLPLAILLELTLITGVSLLISSLATLFRDVERAMQAFMRVLFYLTPVIYPTGRLHGSIHLLFVLNPLVGIFDLNRAVFFPDTPITGQMVAISIIGSVFFLVVGWAVFMRLEKSMLKEL